MEVIIILLGTSLPEDHNSVEDNPISTDYRLPKEVVEAGPGVVPEVGADTWEEVADMLEEAEELERDNQEVSAEV